MSHSHQEHHDNHDHRESHDRRGHHAHGHSHSIGLATAGRYLNRAFIFGIALNLIFVVVEFGAGLAFDSVALMSDAGHNLSDVVGLALALLAFRLARRKPSAGYTYGRKKSTVVAALANACILLIAIGIIFAESIAKLRDPQPVPGGAIAWVAGAGIVINGFTAWLFLRHKNADLNVKGAYLHMVADALVSIGVLFSGLAIRWTGWYVIDPVVGMAIAVIIFISTWDLLKNSLRLSLDGVPPGMDAAEVAAAVKHADDRIIDVHHVHIWPLSTTETALTAHIVTGSVNGHDDLKRRIRDVLHTFGIDHSTLEFELPGEKERESCNDCG